MAPETATEFLFVRSVHLAPDQLLICPDGGLAK
jgi:hypothetical protein